VIDVALHRSLAEHEVGGNLGVGHALPDEREHLALTRGEDIEALGGGRDIRRRAIGGQDPPGHRRIQPGPASATVRTARCRSSAGTPLRRKPDAPARSAAARISSSSNVVSSSTGGGSAIRPIALVGGHAIDDGHADVHQHDVRLQANHGGGDARPVSTFADNVEAVPLAQDAGSHRPLLMQPMQRYATACT
jgi:hypothetical protein